MVDFENQTRKRCRHCKMKLPEPTSNDRQAFCTRGCYNSFYLHKCRVCEKPIEQPKRGNRLLCKKPKCQAAWQRKDGMGKYATVTPDKGVGAGKAKAISEMPANQAVLSASKPVEWRVIAGPELTASQFHCATVPDGEIVDGVPSWEGGSYERIEAKNRSLLKAHFAEMGEKAAIQRQHMPLNIQGGYQPKYRLLKLKDGSDAGHKDMPDPVIAGVGYDQQSAPKQPRKQASPLIPDDLSIPSFLRRPLIKPEPERLAA